MADPKLLDELTDKQKLDRIPAVGKRPTLRASLREFPQVRRRQELNFMLLANGCGNGGTTDVRLRPSDLKLLVQIAEERGSNTNPLLRQQAINALVQFRQLDAAATLARLARSELEHQSVRISALTALHTLSPDLAYGIDVGYHKAETSPKSRVKKGAPPRDKK
jgi:hypothetical protein